jgi:hypothetical protein
MTKEVNTPRELKIAKIILVLLLVLLGYLSMSFYPSWTWHIYNLKAQAKVVSIDEKNNVVTYSYFNQSKFKEITLERRLKTKSELSYFNLNSNYTISYSYYVPQFVIFDLFDKPPKVGQTIFAVVVVLMGILLYSGVVLNRISLKALAGVKGNKT